MQAIKRKWLIFSILGLILIGAGLSLAIDAGFYRMQHRDGLEWIYYGTFALLVFNSGLCCFGQGVIYKIKLDHLAEN
ncbi:hypothetical protein [Marivirga harenae]|uniref:hypothetical protein n=1 Tax=Marivirga harenae TaxID=2010992 RepID=UPI0026E0549E|nr:hypothetical protein [Marivirga harenae]WKV13062.1 hypothetical protein Q3Y49_04375 [Marivirga harenae]|tara:strand:+ start:199369 stop:199599 length:231 start_codon:yes stop_codon:yes gene_type:complete